MEGCQKLKHLIRTLDRRVALDTGQASAPTGSTSQSDFDPVPPERADATLRYEYGMGACTKARVDLAECAGAQVVLKTGLRLVILSGVRPNRTADHRSGQRLLCAFLACLLASGSTDEGILRRSSPRRTDVAGEGSGCRSEGVLAGSTLRLRLLRTVRVERRGGRFVRTIVLTM